MNKVLRVIIISGALIISCKHDILAKRNSITSTVITGDFMVAVFYNGLEDRTSDFAGFDFTFNIDGTITAVNNNETFTGSYTEKPAEKNKNARLKIEFADEPLEELNKNWQVDVLSDSAIHLSDDKNSNKNLVFETP